MRFLIYTMLIGLVALILADTDYGRPIIPHERQLVYQAIRHMDSKGFGQDAEIALKITNSSHFRYSRFLSNATALFRARGANFGYYAYTPLFSRSRVFVGQSFWEVGDVGQSSIISHELAHIRRHRERFLRGFPRHADEAQAYQRQYETYRALGLKPYGPDAPVYWDMMIGIQTYLLPEHPEYAKRSDIRWAMGQLDQEEKPFAGIAIALLYVAIAAILLVGGDRLGSRIACGVLKRCSIPSLLHLGEWVVVPVALLLPVIILLGFVTVVLEANKADPVQVLANNLEMILLAAFFLTGIVGGFLVQARRPG